MREDRQGGTWSERRELGRERADAPAGERYLLLADISGYTGFMAGVEQEHGLDFSGGIPAAYPMLAALLGTIIAGVEPDLAVVKLEGDAVFAAAPAASLDGQGDRVLEKLRTMYRAFIESRTRAIPSSDHICTACPAVASLDLKAVLHRGPAVRQTVGSGSDLLGPAVTVAHRLLKNTIRAADRLPSLPVPDRRGGDRARTDPGRPRARRGVPGRGTDPGPHRGARRTGARGRSDVDRGRWHLRHRADIVRDHPRSRLCAAALVGAHPCQDRDPPAQLAPPAIARFDLCGAGRAMRAWVPRRLRWHRKRAIIRPWTLSFVTTWSRSGVRAAVSADGH